MGSEKGERGTWGCAEGRGTTEGSSTEYNTKKDDILNSRAGCADPWW